MWKQRGPHVPRVAVAGRTHRPAVVAELPKKAGTALLVVDESEVRAALTASVEMDAVEVFVLEFRRVIAVGLDGVAEFGVASVEELFVHWLVAVRPNAQSLFDR